LFFKHTKYSTYLGRMRAYAQYQRRSHGGVLYTSQECSSVAKLAALAAYDGPEELLPPSLRNFDREEAAEGFDEVQDAWEEVCESRRARREGVGSSDEEDRERCDEQDSCGD